MKRILVFVAFALGLVGCGSGGGQGGSPPASKQVESLSSPASAGLETGAAADASSIPVSALPRKIIYTGQLSVVTEDLDKAGSQLETRVKEFDGYIGDATKSGSRGEVRTASWTVRIPSTKFDAFVKAVSTIGELESSSRSAQDVSEEFYDVAARLKNKKVEEQRLVELLQKATGKLTEVLTVEKELSRVRSEVEQIEGRLRFLSNQTDLSTLTVSMREVKNYVPEGPPTFVSRVKRTFSGSISFIKELGEGAILFLVALSPLIVIVGLGLWVIRLRKRPRVRLPEGRSEQDNQP